ncbi:response regulator transcription factor [Alteromonas sp. ASW11-130]|uniref:response regulator transcription factor n=1 Tax=Alteromonas sp. ASW11-130 TaxID=3015775 RepID=UPI002242AE1E|nr:response regulator transcription factor [Alteromonas sp. ASW11-130]MCW8091430.1 response regulator transcription factor [Alteromonas sp. ASW11-130]
MQPKVLIADDHPIFRAAMRYALADIVGENLVEAESYPQTHSILQTDPDVEVVFLDINMPGNEGLTGLSEIRACFPDVIVVMVSAEENPQLIRKAIDLGSSGYIPKSTPLPVLNDAVRQIIEGDQWLPQTISGALPDLHNKEQQDFAQRMTQLTPHQFMVLKLIADGLLNKQIAYHLDISESTVKQHVSAVLRKLNVINRTQAGIIFKQLIEKI